MIILATRYSGETEPVCFEVTEGEIGIPIFDTIEDAEEFAEAYRELLGPGLEAMELPAHAIAQLLLGSVQTKPSTLSSSRGLLGPQARRCGERRSKSASLRKA